TVKTERGFLNVLDFDGLGTDTVTFSGADRDLFDISLSGGTYTISFKAGLIPDYETQSAYTLTVTVDDPSIGSGPEDSLVITVPVGNQDDPTIALPSNVTLNENSIFVLTSDQFHQYDQDSTPLAFEGISLLTLPGNGRLFYDADGGDPSNAVAL